MKILHVITSLRVGGAERLMVDLLPRLRALGHEVELLVFDGVDTPFKQALAGQGITIHELSVGDNVYHPKHIAKLRHFVKNYDVIHTHNTACQLFVPIAKALTRSHVKLITTEHNATNRRRGKWWWKPLDRLMYRQYDRVICIANQTRINLEQHIGANSKICTVYNGVDVDRFLNPINDISSNRHFIVVMIAGFREQKDQDTAIRAMNELPEQYSLWLVGDGERRPALEALIEELDLGKRVKLLGVCPHVPQLLQQCDVVVLSSHWEGLSLSSIEGMASGRPFIASDVDGLHEMVQGSGVLFEHGDAQALASAIRLLCENPAKYEQVAQKCQARAKQFDIAVMAKRYVQVYQEIVS